MPSQVILEAIAHLDHLLPGQAPIHDFVHHNTLHGFQHLPFEQALAQFTALTGMDCYQPAKDFRSYYAQGRISDADLDATLDRHFALTGPSPLCSLQDRQLDKRQLFRAILLHDLSAISPSELQWQLQEDLARDANATALWQAVLDKLALHQPELHVEQLLDLSQEQAENWHRVTINAVRAEMRGQALEDLSHLFDAVGQELTLPGLLQRLTGVDILEQVRPQLIRWCASLLDEGLAAWRLPNRQELGLYGAWRDCAAFDAQALLQELPDWEKVWAELPDNPIAAIAQQLEAMALPMPRWAGYLQRLALEIPGWSGLINWRQTHTGYHAGDAHPIHLADYLALRLILDRLYLKPLCQTQFRCEARLDKLHSYFHKNSHEFSARLTLFSGDLPEYLTREGLALLATKARSATAWRLLAERIWTWRCSPLAASSAINIHDHGWRLFVLCRALALSPAELTTLERDHLLNWLNMADKFDTTQQRHVWLCAYERHYQQDLLQALHANRGRGQWARREDRPVAQVYFCMDEREESFRRHLEEVNPAIETLGVAGFFGVAMNYQGLDDHHPTPLCPVVVTPQHRVREIAQEGQESALRAHRHGLKLADGLAYQLYQNLRASLLSVYPLQFLLAPIQLLRLLGKLFWPTGQRLLESAWRNWLIPPVATKLQFIADEATLPIDMPKIGFSDAEQAERVEQFLRATGLTYGFGRLVVLLGHGSTSQNNPHEAAHDCGACGGRQGGPNARTFAAMANRDEVRKLLTDRGIEIPGDTWFIGGQHDTCSDIITWYDLDAIPAYWQADFAVLQANLLEADGLAATERCRRFASSGRPRSGQQAIRHVENRAMDPSQVRPEFGHATNAAAFIGRRSATRGVFFDRRLFLISYDPFQDTEGAILENILLTAGPVGAGINLEYYFSSVNNDGLGCGTKIPHNVTGLFGVMEGAGSDLRTGLPLQMVEIHEAMRLQIVVEAKTATMAKIYDRQPALRELIGGGWVHVCAMDPEDGRLFVFQRGEGFVPWQPQDGEPPLRSDSADCYRDETGPVPPMLISRSAQPGAANP
ncbi:MAG: DUF2309 domain-containing protein [Methylomonas sp.]|nr:DUF2309 domain-containing protein [Methylomonas sp.]